jgi:c-di-GMP-binding flagellar brake protein YcgR
MNIRIGTKLSINLEGKEDYFTTYFIGEKKDQHIVLAFPEKKQAYIEKINNQTEIYAQYFDNGARYEFKSRIIELLEEPVDLIVLEYPSEICSVNKRAMDRINCLVSAKLKNQMGNDDTPVIGVIGNINKTGCLCNLTKIESAKISFSLGDPVGLKCQFPGLVGEHSAEGKIVRIQEKGEDIILGINFDREIWWVPPYERK